ncbi:MAG: glycosyltransferase family 2 protein [Deltaproteobacteria bacterium]|jgi:hypothetical protein|nr:glycosyltransferase family 2 protein [Deltaproteobacteria bacterium]
MSAYIDTLPVWPQDRDTICTQIRHNYAPFKVILKTRNDSFFLERWIKHYLAITRQTEGRNQQGIIIFDNMSTDAEVLRLYEKYRDELLVIRFAGDANKLHCILEHLDLYMAVILNSQFYAFLDTDEFLYLSDGKRFATGAVIGKYLAAHQEVNFFGSMWLENEPESYNTFRFSEKDAIRQLIYGKPILNSAVMHQSLRMSMRNIPILLHNLELSITQYCKTPVCFVLVHYNKFITQRLRACLNKLVTCGLVDLADFDNLAEIHAVNIPTGLAELAGHPKFAALLKVDPADVQPHPRGYLLEIQALLNGQMINKIAEDGLTFGSGFSLGMQDSGHLVFSDPADQALFQKYVGSKTDFFEILEIPPPTDEQLKQSEYMGLAMWKLLVTINKLKSTPPSL